MGILSVLSKDTKPSKFMKSFPKILTIFFLTVFILQIICLVFLLMAPVASQAAEKKIDFKQQVEMPGYTFDSASKSTINIANYIRAIYKYAIGIVGILAAVILMVGGIIWLTAGGNASMVTEAKAWITASITGLVLALCSYFILATVNPNLVNFKITEIETIEKLKIATDAGIKEVEKEMIKEKVSPAIKKATIEAIQTQSLTSGCCFYEKSKKCIDEVLKTDCSNQQTMNYYPGLCKYIINCPQFCTRVKAGTDCSNSYLNPAVCTFMISGKNRCEKCDKKEGESCVNHNCCAGLCCGKIEGKRTPTCIKGTPTRGNSCK